MSFVNEYISDEDAVKYGIDNINSKYIGSGVTRQWTIDRIRNVYLREVSAGVGHDGGGRIWHLYWKSSLIELNIEIISSGEQRGGECWAHKKIKNLKIPTDLIEERNEIISLIKEALVSYKDGGVFSTATAFTLTLDI